MRYYQSSRCINIINVFLLLVLVFFGYHIVDKKLGDRLIREVGTSSYKFGKLTGFKIDSVPEKSILKKIGLRRHDKILALNDTPIEGETGAFEFFEQIAQGKKVTIKYRRRNRTRRIELNPV